MLTLDEIRKYDLNGADDAVTAPCSELNLAPVKTDQLGKRKDIGSMIKEPNLRQIVKDIRNGTWNGSLDLGGMPYEEFVRRVEAGEYDRMKGLTQP